MKLELRIEIERKVKGNYYLSLNCLKLLDSSTRTIHFASAKIGMHLKTIAHIAQSVNDIDAVKDYIHH